MNVKALNSMLEKNAFVHVTSGKIDAMDFGFTTNNTNATGDMQLLYHGLDLAVKDKQIGDTSAIKEQIISFIANIKVMDANPLQGGSCERMKYRL